MKSFTFFILATSLFLTYSCGQSYQEYGYEEDYYGEENYSTYSSEMASLNGGEGDLVRHPVRNAQTGQLSGYIPLPADWKVTREGIYGPNGSVVKDFPPQSLQGRNIQSIDQLIQTDIAHMLRQGNVQLVGTIDLPEIARNDDQIAAQYWKFAPTQDLRQVRGLEVKSAQGTMGLMIVHFTQSHTQWGSMASYFINYLEARPSAYEEAKRIYIYGLANYRPDAQAVAAFNQQQQRDAGISIKRHNESLAAGKRRFNEWNRSRETMNETSDIIMNTYTNTSAMKDNGHQSTIDGIYDRDEMVDPYGNGTIHAPTEYDQYYMNQNGEYIGTNNAFYNPQNDPNLNNTEWREVKRKRDNW
ncbi:MAG: hypothetical protein AAF587_33865 [Bacteroidota bacterium]